VVPWAAGGGRIPSPDPGENAKKHFGVNVNVVNKTGDWGHRNGLRGHRNAGRLHGGVITSI